MVKRLGLTVAVAIVATASMAALAPAKTLNAKTSLEMALSSTTDPSGTPVGDLRGSVVVLSQVYCEQKRKVEIFRDGKKIGTKESDRYGGWAFGLNPLEPGRYVAKTKRTLLPISTKENRIFCGAAQSKPIVVP